MAVGEKTSPLHIWSKSGGWFGAKRRKAERERTDQARKDLDKSIEAFEGLDTSNIYRDAQNVYAGARNVYAGAQNKFANVRNQFANLENTMEDLTVNTQQADFEREQFQQSQANLLQNLQGAAGGSGVAGLAQALANQGAQQARRSAASIGQQEAANQMAAAQQAGANQMASAQGAQAAEMARAQGAAQQQQMIMSGAADQQAQILGGAATQQQMVLGGAAAARDLEYQKQQGIIAARTGQFESAAEEQRYNSTGAQIGRFMKAAGEFVGNTEDTAMAAAAASDRRLKKNISKIGQSPSGLNIYSFEYIDTKHGEGVYQGVMSDEVPREAVSVSFDGYEMVHYNMIDVNFKQI
jgi:hypothetical protein